MDSNGQGKKQILSTTFHGWQKTEEMTFAKELLLSKCSKQRHSFICLKKKQRVFLVSANLPALVTQSKKVANGSYGRTT